MKWLRGLRWEEIDSNFVSHHVAGEKEITHDLKKAAMVMQELDIIRMHGKLPTSGPMIVSEYDNLPWDAVEFRRWWRRLADECNIPSTVRNSDSRVRRSATGGNRDDEREQERELRGMTGTRGR